MGLLVDGVWHDEWYNTEDNDGKFIREDAQFRDWISKDGKFQPEAGRYHLYVCLACPWASRCLMMRKLKGLEEIISLSVVNPVMLEHGWTFEDGPGVIADPIIDADYMHEIYTHVDPTYSGRVTVPVLYDKKTDTIVNNESSDIIRMMNTAFDEIGATPGDYYPADLRDEIDDINDYVYDHVNNGVYKAGFATEQQVYEKEAQNVDDALAKLNDRLENKDYLVGDQLTEADIRLFTTLIRFEHVYFGHFKCNLHHLTEYPHLWEYTKRIYNYENLADTVNFDHIQTHYYKSHTMINPNQIIPAGPDLDLSVSKSI
ncbi:glutathione-dependent reductase [Dolosigranulum pigrum]|uniref:glutathione S-transferase family protein n=1 Tax=Dolosigranulum pigrum TaxID=29394 RepID=UPI000DBF4854|nr:glutathione S-transferase family protein [Dolosigranulum pigrum]RAN56171.1 glutathione-dependent reductase [Dolosigranulum pigrum]RAN58050.1 glutathione-dependent reductase [Dolosigranulum pigrum]VTU65073.1 glutathione-dependent reductase [Lactobacillus murinus] [Dolosigranulum pigrum]